MQFTQQESRRLTGNRIDVEIVNLPDTVNGVLFNRGGFQRALLYPFVLDNALHHRERIVTIEHAENEDLQIEGVFPEPAALDWRMDPEERVTTRTRHHHVRVVFQPREARTYRGEIIIRNAECRESVAKIPVRGQGTTAVPLPTSLAAAVRPGPAPADPTQPLTHLAAVADVPDGIPAEGVSISLLPGVP